MALDITILTGQGITKWESQEIEYPSNDRNAFKYKVRFLKFVYDSFINQSIGLFSVRRYVEQNEEWVEDIFTTTKQ
jgi:hypothetical protein